MFAFRYAAKELAGEKSLLGRAALFLFKYYARI